MRIPTPILTKKDQVPAANTAEFNPATTFSRAAEEGVIDPAHSLHIGARGSISAKGVFEYTRSKGFELITGIELNQMGTDETLKHIHDRLHGRPVYVCWDMDFFDPSCAPGVFTPDLGRGDGPRGIGSTARPGGSQCCRC